MAGLARSIARRLAERVDAEADARGLSPAADVVLGFKRGIYRTKTASRRTNPAGILTTVRLGDESAFDGSRTFAPNVPAVVPNVGLQVYEQRTNRAPTDLSNPAWSLLGGSTAVTHYAGAGPDGAFTLTRIKAASGTGGGIYCGVAVTAGVAETWSWTLKRDAGTPLVRLQVNNNSASAFADVNTSNWTLGTVTGLSATAKITAMKNDCYRVDLTFVPGATETSLSFVFDVSGDGSRSFFAGQPDMQAGSFATPHIVNGKNLLANSSDAANASWAKSGQVTTTATTILSNNATGGVDTYFHQQGPISVGAGVAVAHTRRLKAVGGLTWASLSIYDSNHRQAFFNLATGQVGTIQSGLHAAYMVPAADEPGYYDCTVVRVLSGAVTAYATLFLNSADNQLSFLGASYSVPVGQGVSQLRAQLERAVPATSPGEYEETTTAAGVRNLLFQSNNFASTNWDQPTLGAGAPVRTAEGMVTLDASRLNTRQMVTGLTVGRFYRFSVEAKRAPFGSATHTRATTNNTAVWNSGASQKVALTDEWQRVATVAFVATTTAAYVMKGAIDVSGVGDPDCYGNVMYRRALFEEGPYTGTSYDDTTTGTTSTRGAATPAKVIGTLAAPFTAFVSVASPGLGVFRPFLSLEDGTTDNRVYITGYGADVYLEVQSGGALQAAFNAAAAGRNKAAVVMAADGTISAFLNGVKLGSSAAGKLAPVGDLTLRPGWRTLDGNRLNGVVEESVLFGRAHSDAEAIALTAP